MNNFKPLILLCIIILSCFSAIAQTPAPASSVKLFFEKVFIHTDRSLYAANEDIWFKAYVTNGQDNHLIGTSKNLYVELIAPADTLVSKEIIHLDNGLGKGDFKLPENAAPGTYRIRAYTNWMRNFGSNFLFEKNITVAGSESSGKKGASKTITKRSAAGATGSGPGGAVIRLFPEGGSLVNELTSLVGVKAEAADGKGIALNGAILSAAGDTITHFTCDTLGFGLFAMLPIAGQDYHAVALYNRAPVTTPLPVPLSKGLSVKIYKKDTLIYAIVRCNPSALADYAGKNLNLVGRYTGQQVFQQDFQLKNSQVEMRIPESSVPEGIIAFTLYDDQHKPNCERLFYVNHLHNNTTLSVNTAKSAYQSREKVSVKINVAHAGRPVKGNFSLAAVDANLAGLSDGNIVSYLMLQSEIRGEIEHPDRYFDTTNVSRFKQLDQLMLTQGWRDFVWKRMADTAIKVSYLPEQGFSLSGRVRQDIGGKPIAGANITLSAPHAAGAKLLFTQTDASGNYYFDNLQLNGEQNIKVTSRDAKAKADGFIQLDSLSKNALPLGKPRLADYVNVNEGQTSALAKRVATSTPQDSIIALREVKIRAQNVVTLRDQTAVSFGYKDEVFNVTPKDFSFGTLREYILYSSKQAKIDPNSDEIVFFADGKTYKPRIVIDNKEDLFTDDSDDAIKSHYYSVYYNLPMNVVNKVTIKRLLSAPKLVQGPAGAANAMGNTVAASRISEMQSLFMIYLNLKPYALEKKEASVTTGVFEGYFENRTFFKPLHPQGADVSGKADLRTTIHWEPQIRTDDTGNATISFYNADPKSKIQIIVQGVTDTGVPLAGSKTYIVK